MRCGTGNGMPGVFVPFALAAGFSLLSTATMASGPEIREFRDWRAGCDNVGHCTALSLPDDEDNAIAYLRLDRAAGADAPVRLVLRVLGDWKTVSVPLRLTLDGTAFPATAEAAQVGTDSGTISLTFQPAEASAFVAAARKATQLSISTPDMTAHVSLSGSVAAMLWIDEQQGRLDTPSALIRKGSGSHVPAALALPVITAKVPDGVLADDAGKALAEAVRQEMLRRDSDLCEDEETLAALDEAWLLDGTRRLVGLACSRGAYNVTTGFWTVEGGDAATAQPALFPSGAGEMMENMLVNAQFDPKTGRLDFFSRGRGIGDCGAIGGYAWTGDGFVRTHFSMMGECRGIAPDDWIALYRSTAK
jgi:hypothetical protein